MICKRNLLRDTYKEIFTNSTITVSDDLCIEPLSSYYSLLTVCNYTTGKPLMIDKKLLLKQYLSINGKANLEKGKSLSEIENSINGSNKILEKATTKFFPKDGKISENCSITPLTKKLSMENLPYHLRNDVWLAKMLKQNQKLSYISTNKILQFVKESQFFREKRHEYEQEIVKCQIDLMKSDKENLIINDDNCDDLNFREGIVDTLSKIGMSLEAIEEGIEKNADRWRNSFMESTFNKMISSEESKTLEPDGQEFKEKWLKLRKYEYYQRHKDSVDKYGIVESEMTLSDKEVVELKAYLGQKQSKIITQIEPDEQYTCQTHGLVKVLKK